MAEQMNVVEQLNEVEVFIERNGKKYALPEGFEGSTAFVREAEDGVIEVREVDSGYDRWEEAMELPMEPVYSGRVTVAQWRTFVEQIEDAIDELVVVGQPEAARLELPLPPEGEPCRW
jgi:hypothetical protein